MDAEMKAKWVAALRSGKYKQGMLRLRSKRDEYCCFGVFCDVIDSTRWKLSGMAFRWAGTNLAILPSSLRQQVGIGDADEDHLLNMNDTGSTFAQIADWIEVNI